MRSLLNSIQATYLTAVVCDVGADTFPTNSTLRSSSLRVEQRLHALRVEAAALHQVDYSKAIVHPGLHVPDSEVKPLRMLAGVQICAQGEFIIIGTPEQETTH